MNCQKGRLLVFLLANSWVGQNSGSIELYFLFSFRMDGGCSADRAEPTKIEDRGNQPRPDRSDSKWAPVKWVVRSIGCLIDWTGGTLRESNQFLHEIVSF